MKKKKKKCYLSCYELKKITYQRALLTRYQLMFIDDILDADIFLAAKERDGLSDRQKRELEEAEAIGIEQRVILNGEIIIDEREKDPLSLNREDKALQEKKLWIENEDDFELGLR